MYNKSHKLEKKYIILIILLFLTIFLGLASKIVKEERPLNPVEKVIKDSVLLVNRIVYYPVNFVKNKIGEYQDKKDLYNKYKKLEQQIDAINSKDAKIDELNRELEQMKSLLELNKTLESSTYLNATIINRDLGYWYNTITIDKGEKNGITKDMPVIVGTGLVGKVIKTSNFNSTVKLITADDLNNKISVKIKLDNNYVYGLLTKYNNKNGTFVVEGIDTNKKISIGSVVTTTGLGDIFPSGIIVGKVSNITTDSFDLAQILEIKSDVNFDNLSFVTVLKRDAK